MGSVWPWTATPVSPIARATATTLRTRAGTILDENSGATTNSGVTRARTRKKPVMWSPPIEFSSVCSEASFTRSAAGSTM